MPGPTVVILAAGEGTRMRSSVPKVLHPLCGRPLIDWPIAAAREAGAEAVVVVDGPNRPLAEHLPAGVEVAIQEVPRGTGDAVKAATAHFAAAAGPVVILMGDVPLVTGDFISDLVAAHARGGTAATMVTMELEEPGSYGRVLRRVDGAVQRVVEAKGGEGDARPEHLAIREVNTGIYCFDAAALAEGLQELRADNAQGEYYLPDVLPILDAKGHGVQAHLVDDFSVTLGVNDRVDLALIRVHAQRRINDSHMRAGVTIVDPASTAIDADVRIGADTVVEPFTSLKGSTSVGEGGRIGPLSTIIDATLGDRVTVPHSYVNGAFVQDDCTIGPFAHLRPGAHLHPKAKAGTFVEIKNSVVGPRAKVPHLSYIGDTDIGEDSNIGAGTITANYDGRAKHRTRIGARVRVSVHTSFVAPVAIGDDATTGAGSVITDDVPPRALGIARQRQTNVDGYADREKPKERP